jgi:hypothetical protein
MKYVKTEKGIKYAENGNPFAVGDDGKEIEIDPIALYSKVKELNNENAARRLELRQAKEAAALFDGLDPDAARAAIDSLAKIDQKKLIDAGKVDEVRQQMKEEYEKKLAAKDTDLSARDKTIYDLMVANKFSASSWFNGDKPKTVLTPALAKAYWGENFRIEDGRVAAYTSDGKQILSSADPSKPADFDEAIEILISSNPDKDKLLRANGGGPGGFGGKGGASTVTTFVEFTALPVKEKAALVGKMGRAWVEALPKE